MIETGFPDYKAIEPEIVLKIAKDNTSLIVTPADQVSWQNQTPGIATFQADLLTGLIQTAREILEKYCWIDLTQCTYQAYFDLQKFGIFNLFLPNIRLLLNRAPIMNINNIMKIEYLDNTGAWINFDFGTPNSAPGLFANITNKIENLGWASLYFINPPAWASTMNAYKARVTFNAGYDLSYSGTVSVSYDSVTGIVTAVLPSPGYLNNNGMTVAISNVGQTAYNGLFPITVINSTTFTYQLATGLTLTPGTGNYVSTPNSLYSIPKTLITAIKNIVAYNYSTRGDVPSAEDLLGYPVPSGTRGILDQYNVGKVQIGQDLC